MSESASDGTYLCPECDYVLYSHTQTPGILWCDGCEREYWQENGKWYSCGVDGEYRNVPTEGEC